MANIDDTTTQTNFTTFMQTSTSFLVLSYAVAAIAILLNGIEIMLIVRKIKRSTNFEFVLLNLAIADLLNSVLFVIATIITQYSEQRKELQFDYAFYWVTGALTFSITASVSFVAVIGIERFIAIRLPLQHRLWHTSRRKLVKYIIITWLFDVILIVTLSINDNVIHQRGWTLLSSTGMRVFAGLLTFGSVLILLLYGWVLHLMMLRSLKSFDFDKTTLRVNSKQIREAMKKEKSSIVICILVVASFLGCNIPLIADAFNFKLTKTSAMLQKLSAVLNPLIYFFKGYVEKYHAKQKLASSGDQRHNSNIYRSRGQGPKDVADVDHRLETRNSYKASNIVEQHKVDIVESIVAEDDKFAKKLYEEHLA